MLIRFFRLAGGVLASGVALQLCAQTPGRTVPSLLTTLPTPGTIVSERRVDSLGITEWKLSNGAVVYVKPTTYKDNQVLLKGIAPGGLSTLSDADYPTARFLQLTQLGGFGSWSPEQLRERLSGTSVNAAAAFGPTAVQMLATSAPAEVEAMLQLVYLEMTAPRYDSVATARFLQQVKLGYAAKAANPEGVLEDSVGFILGNHAKDAEILTPASIAQVDPKRAMAIYRDFFADASSFRFIFVGNVNPDSLKPLVAHYLASLPTLHRHQEAKDMIVPHGPPGVVHRQFSLGREESAKTFLYFFGKYDTPHDRIDISILSQILSARLSTKLREELGGTYQEGVAPTFYGKPISTYGMVITFISDPARRAEMVKATFAVIDSLKRMGPSASEVSRIVDASVQAGKLSMRTNGFWMGLVDRVALEGQGIEDIRDQSYLQSVTPAQIQRAAQRYLDMTHYTELARVPEPEK